MNTLYLSYDGMTDPLGQSQVIPYLVGLRRAGHEITLLSCEKQDRFAARQATVRELLDREHVRWVPLIYHPRPPVLSTIYDLFQMSRTAARLHAHRPFELVHCRSYPPSLVGHWMARKFGCRFVFDMRGFWADERVEGGVWRLRNPLYAAIYRFFKRKEITWLRESDAVVTLTRKAREEIVGWRLPNVSNDKISVIPCCADLQHFRRDNVELALMQQIRSELGLAEDNYVVVYLGSVGTWYLLDEMLDFFRHLHQRRPHARLVFFSPDAPDYILGKAAQAGIPQGAVAIRYCERAELPSALSLADLGLYFIRPCFSKGASSPTKMAELLAMGIPVVTNSGVGDSEWISSRYALGPVVRNFTPESYESALDELEKALPDPQHIRRAAEEQFSLEGGVATYASIYARVAPAQTETGSGAVILS